MRTQKVFVNPNAGEVKSNEIIDEIRRILSDLEQGKNIITSASIRINSMTYIEFAVPMFHVCELPEMVASVGLTDEQFQSWLFSITKYLMWYDNGGIPEVVMTEFLKRYTMMYVAIDRDEDLSKFETDSDGNIIPFTVEMVNAELRRREIPHQFIPYPLGGYQSKLIKSEG